MKPFVFIGIIMAALVLSAAFIITGQWLPALVTVGLGALWLANVWLKWAELTWLWLTAFTGLAAWGIWLDAPAMVILVGTTITLVVWDLARFSRRLTQVEFVNKPTSLSSPHLQRLSIVAAVGVLLGSAAMGLQINLTFGWAILLVLLMVISLSVAIAILRRSSQ